jgi:hypothetical protein
MTTPKRGGSRRVAHVVEQNFTAGVGKASRFRSVASPAYTLEHTFEPCAVLEITFQGHPESEWPVLAPNIKLLQAEMSLQDVRWGGMGYELDLEHIQIVGDGVKVRFFAKQNVGSTERAERLQAQLRDQMTKAIEQQVVGFQEPVEQLNSALAALPRLRVVGVTN